MSTVRYGDHRSLSTLIPLPWILIGLVTFTLSVRTVGAMDVNGQSFSHRDMKGAKVVDDILEKMTDSINTLSEDEKQQDRNDWTEFKEKTEKMNSKVKKTIKSLRAAADKLDQAWWDCKVVQATGTTAAIVGGVLTIGGGIATLMTARAATPLLIAGTTFGIAGSTVNLRAIFTDADVNSAEIKKVEKLFEESKGNINQVKTFVHERFVKKESARLLYIYVIASETRELVSPDSALKLLRGLILHSVGIPSKMAGVEETVAAVSQAALKSSAKDATQGGALGAGKAGAQATDDLAQGAGQFGAKATTQEAGKAGAQAADDLAQGAGQFGAKATTQEAGKAGAQAADDLAQGAGQFGAKATTQEAGKAGAQAADDLAQGAGQFVAKATTQEAGKAGAQAADDLAQGAGQFGAKATTQEAGKAGAQAADDLAQGAGQFGAKATTQEAGKAGAQTADDLAQGAGQFGAKATTQEAGKAGAQAADDVMQAGTKTGSKFAEKLIFGINAAFLMFDAVDLGFTIRDLVQNKGSDAAKILREKADELEDVLK